MTRLRSSKLKRVLQKTMPTHHIRFQDFQTINGRRLAHQVMDRLELRVTDPLEDLAKGVLELPVRILLADRVVAMAVGLAPNNSKGVNGVEMSGLR
jgi:hypothetical protein